MKLFVGALLFVAVQAASLGSDKCTRGPSYWCSSIGTANKCQSFSHCLDTVWKTQLLDVQQTKVCKHSQKLVKTIRRVISNKSGQEEVIHLIATMCSFAHDDTMRKECKNQVTHFLPEISQLMESDVKPASVAELMGLCKPYDGNVSNTTLHLKGGAYHPSTNSALCTECKAFANDIHTLPTYLALSARFFCLVKQNVFLKVLDPVVCSELDDLAVLCKAFIEASLPKVFNKEFWPGRPCQLSSFCLSTMEEKPRWLSVYDNMTRAIQSLLSGIQMHGEQDISCHGCEKDLTAVIAYGKNSYFRQAMENSIMFLCFQTGRSEDTCRNLADGFIPIELTSIMSRDVNVREVCKSTLGCKEPESPLIVKPPSTTFCNDCKRFFAEVRVILKDNVLIRPGTVCSDLGLCPKTAETSEFHFVQIFSAAWKKKLLGNINCDQCQVLMVDFLASNRTSNIQAALVDFFNIICDKLGHEREQCKDLIQRYSPGLTDILASMIDPRLACDSLLGCAKTPDSEENEEATRDVGTQTSGEGTYAEKEKSASPIKCELCKEVISSLQQLIGENKSEEVIQNALEDICKDLPTGITPQCLSFVDEYASVVVKLVQQELDPDQICHALGLCSSSATFEEHVLPMADSEADSLECELCKAIITQINNLLVDNRTEAAVIHAIEIVCDVVQGDLRLQCKSEVENYGPAVLDLLRHMDDPTQVCSFLHECSPTLNVVSSAGTSRYGKQKRD